MICFNYYRNLNEIVQQIDYTIINNLKTSILIALNNSLSIKTIIDTYLMLAQYCLEDFNYKSMYIIYKFDKKIFFLVIILLIVDL